MSEQTVMWLYIAAAITTVWVLTWELLKGALKGLGRLWNGTVGARQNQKRLINRPGLRCQRTSCMPVE